MTGPLANRTAIVTGGGRGIGAAAAGALTALGARSHGLLPDHRRARPRWSASGGAALAVTGDVSREEDVARLVAEHERALGPCRRPRERRRHPSARPRRGALAGALRATLEVNLTGAFLCSRAVIPGMKARRRGRIVNVASISGTLGTPAASAYNASKWGLIGFTKCLAEELREHGVQCLAVSPGSVDTAMLAKTPFSPADDAERRRSA